MSAFKATMDDSKILRPLMEAISYLIEETFLIVTPDAIKINAFDDSRIAMLYAEIPKGLFVEYDCGETFRIGLNVNDLIKILKRAKSNDQLQLFLPDISNPTEISIRMKSGKSTRTFKLKSKTMSEEDDFSKSEDVLEQIEKTFRERFLGSITIESGLLDDIIKDASIISDIITIKILRAENILEFLATDESGEVEIEIDLKGDGILDSEVKDDCRGTYSINFLENILKIQTIMDPFKINLGVDIPLEVEGKIPKEGPEKGKIIYLLAPRVEDDEDFEDELMDDFDEDFDIDDLDED